MKKPIIIMLTGVFLVLILWPFRQNCLLFLNKNSEMIQNKIMIFYFINTQRKTTLLQMVYKVKLNTLENNDIKHIVAKSFKNTPEILRDYLKKSQINGR